MHARAPKRPGLPANEDSTAKLFSPVRIQVESSARADGGNTARRKDGCILHNASIPFAGPRVINLIEFSVTVERATARARSTTMGLIN